jgi:tetratricopeptide (TPR) repeat protein
VTGPENRRKLAFLVLVTLILGGLLGPLAEGDAAEPQEATGEPSEAASTPQTATGEPSETADATGAAPAAADTCRPTLEALLVRGVRMFARQEMREGLEVLAAVVGKRPAWGPAESAYAGALLRSGRFAEAADGFAGLIGEETARLLARGTLSARDLALPVDPEHVLGLAIARHHLGEHRAADRLYRSYADLVEPTSEHAARAYFRLSEMYAEIDVAWGDAEAERAKALAVDPLIETRLALPDLPDASAIAETEPYTREIVLAPDRPEPEEALESLPVLIDWVPPTFTDLAADTEWERGAVEILVGATGRPEDLALPSELDLGSGPGAALGDAAMTWCFEPAQGESGAIALWITLGVDLPAAPPDSLARADADTVEGREEGAPGTVPGAGPAKEGGPPNR